MQKKVLFPISLVLCLWVCATLYYYFSHDEFGIVNTHNNAVINVVYEGRLVPQDMLEVYYYVGNSLSKNNLARIRPSKGGTYLVRRGVYGPQGFLVKIKPSILGEKESEPFGYAFAYWANKSGYQTIVESLVIEKADTVQKYKGYLTITTTGDLRYEINKQLEFKISSEERIIDLGHYGP